MSTSFAVQVAFPIVANQICAHSPCKTLPLLILLLPHHPHQPHHADLKLDDAVSAIWACYQILLDGLTSLCS